MRTIHRSPVLAFLVVIATAAFLLLAPCPHSTEAAPHAHGDRAHGPTSQTLDVAANLAGSSGARHCVPATPATAALTPTSPSSSARSTTDTLPALVVHDGTLAPEMLWATQPAPLATAPFITGGTAILQLNCVSRI
jgi:hypothetical protein